MYATRRFDETDTALTEASRLDQRYSPALVGRALLALEKGTEAGNDPLGFAQMAKGRRGSDSLPGLYILCLTRCTGKFIEESRKELERWREIGGMGPVQEALAYLGLGEMDRAIMSLHTAFEHSNPLLLWLHLWPVFDPLRDYEGFKTLIRRMNLPAR